MSARTLNKVSVPHDPSSPQPVQVEGRPAARIEDHGTRQGLYHNFKGGSLTSTCKPTPAWRQVSEKWMPHHKRQVREVLTRKHLISTLAPPVSSTVMGLFRVERYSLMRKQAPL